jgi:acyl-CoA synthetase (AMP-forming)/AMP-acid ligase II
MVNVGSYLSKRALLNPGLEALVDDGACRRFTFAELNDQADRVASNSRSKRRSRQGSPP